MIDRKYCFKYLKFISAGIGGVVSVKAKKKSQDHITSPKKIEFGLKSQCWSLIMLEKVSEGCFVFQTVHEVIDCCVDK